MSMKFERHLALPAEVKEQYPLTGKVSKIVEEKRAELKAVFEGRLNRLLLIIGPCSADREDAVLDYMNRLALHGRHDLSQEKIERLLQILEAKFE